MLEKLKRVFRGPMNKSRAGVLLVLAIVALVAPGPVAEWTLGIVEVTEMLNRID